MGRESAEGKFMVAVGAIIENTTTDKILLIQRSDRLDFRPGVWEYPIGRIKQFEELDEGLKREVKEETGLVHIQIIKPINVFHFYRGKKTAENEVVGIIYWVQTKSETITLSEEHASFSWLSNQEAFEKIKEEWIKRDIRLYMQEKKLKNIFYG